VIDIAGNALFERAKIDPAGLHHVRSVCIVYQGEQKMLQRRIFVVSPVGMTEGSVQCQLKFSGITPCHWRLEAAGRGVLPRTGRFPADRSGEHIPIRLTKEGALTVDLQRFGKFPDENLEMFCQMSLQSQSSGN
jgi:hypothetical protein